MANGPQKTIYFFDPCHIHQSGEATNVKDDFWSKLFTKVSGLERDDLRMTYRGRKFWGQAGTTKSPAMQYLYLGRARDFVDWPDFADAEEQIGKLPVQHVGTHLIEPAYMTPVSGTRYWAMLRTSGGPSVQALQTWVNEVTGLIDKEYSFELRPYVRRDMQDRLDSAQGASRFHAKFEAAELVGADTSGVIGGAMKKVQSDLGGTVSVEMIVSFGRVKPTGKGSDTIAAELNDLLGKNPSRLQGTILVEDEEGNLQRDQIDLLKDRFTAQTAVDAHEGEPATPEDMMSALSDGIKQFRKHLS